MIITLEFGKDKKRPQKRVLGTESYVLKTTGSGFWILVETI